MFIDLFSYAPLIFHAYFNVKNIDFKTYLLKILEGHRLSHKYQKASIFITIAPIGDESSIDLTSEVTTQTISIIEDENFPLLNSIDGSMVYGHNDM